MKKEDNPRGIEDLSTRELWEVATNQGNPQSTGRRAAFSPGRFPQQDDIFQDRRSPL